MKIDHQSVEDLLAVHDALTPTAVAEAIEGLIGILPLLERAGLPPLGPHSLRHYFATQMLLAGVPIFKVAKLLRHSVKVSKSVYAHILPEDLQNVTEVLVKQVSTA